MVVLCYMALTHSRFINMNHTTHARQFEYWTNRGLAYESMAEEADGDDRCSNSACQFYEASLGNYEHAIILDPENHKYECDGGSEASIHPSIMLISIHTTTSGCTPTPAMC